MQSNFNLFSASFCSVFLMALSAGFTPLSLAQPNQNPSSQTVATISTMASTNPSGLASTLPTNAAHTFIFTGDLFLGNEKTVINERTLGAAYPLFQQPGTVAVFNLEQTLGSVRGFSAKCTPGESKYCYVFNSPSNNYERFISYKPPQSVWVFNQANNHSMDYGLGAQYQTYQTVSGYQNTFSVGTLYNPFQLIQYPDATYAIIGASPHLHTNGIDEGLVEQVANLTRQHIVPIAVLHMGAEGEQEHYVRNREEFFAGRSRGNIYQLARQLIDAGAVAVVAHGPHVARPIQYYKGGVIAYSLGNFMAPYGFSVGGRTGQGLVLQLQLAKNKIQSVVSKAFLHTRHYNPKLYAQGVLLEENTQWVNSVLAEGELAKNEAYCVSFNNEKCEKNEKSERVEKLEAGKKSKKIKFAQHNN